MALISDAQRSVIDAVDRLRRRAVLVSFTKFGVRGLFYGLLAALVTLLFLPKVWLFPVLVTFAGIGLVAGALFSVANTPDDVAVAKAYDDHLGLKDRLSSSISLLYSSNPMVDELLEDTVRTSGTVEPEQLYPLEVPKEAWLLPVPLLILLALLFVPAMLDPAEARDPKLDETLASAASKIADYVAREEGKESTPGRKRVIAKLEKVAAELTRKKYAKKDALAELNKMMDELKEDKSKEEEKKADLNKRLKNFQTNEKTRQLADDIHKGNYQSAANRIKKLIEELKEKIKKLKKKKGKKALEELKKLEKRLKELQDIEAKLLRMMQVQSDINMMGEVLDFLRNIEGDLAELEDPDVRERKFVRMGKLDPNRGKGKKQKIFRNKRRLIPRGSRKAGYGTQDALGKKEKRTKHKKREHKIRIREAKKGQSAFTQTQVANDGSRSQLKAKDVIKAAKKAAEDTIQRQEVPAGYREYLRKYFDGIQPDAPAKKRGKR